MHAVSLLRSICHMNPEPRVDIVAGKPYKIYGLVMRVGAYKNGKTRRCLVYEMQREFE